VKRTLGDVDVVFMSTGGTLGPGVSINIILTPKRLYRRNKRLQPLGHLPFTTPTLYISGTAGTDSSSVSTGCAESLTEHYYPCNLEKCLLPIP
jgi:hypothetical protein